MPATGRKRIRVSPLFARFAGELVRPTRTPGAINRHVVMKIEGAGIEYWLHATKGWRKRSWPVDDVMYDDEAVEDYKTQGGMA